MQSEYKPFNMAKTLVNDKALIGKSKQRIIATLGVTRDSLKNEKIDYLKYRTDKESWDLHLYFKNDTVLDAYLYEEGLDL